MERLIKTIKNKLGICTHNWIEKDVHPMYRTNYGKFAGIYLGTVRKCSNCKKLEQYYNFNSSISHKVFEGFGKCSKIEEEYINKYVNFKEGE